MRIFVGNLPFTVKDDELKTAFDAFGEVASAEVLLDKFTKRSRGFAFVDMPNDDEAKTAIEKLNNSDLGGRKIVVSEARPLKTDQDRPSRPRREE